MLLSLPRYTLILFTTGDLQLLNGPTCRRSPKGTPTRGRCYFIASFLRPSLMGSVRGENF